jgi:hypothetical protein
MVCMRNKLLLTQFTVRDCLRNLPPGLENPAWGCWKLLTTIFRTAMCHIQHRVWWMPRAIVKLATHAYGVVRIARGKLQLNLCAFPDVVTPQYITTFSFLLRSVCHQNYLLLFCFFYPESLPQPNEKYVPSDLVQPHCGPVVDLASNRNEYQDSSWG